MLEREKLVSSLKRSHGVLISEVPVYASKGVTIIFTTYFDNLCHAYNISYQVHTYCCTAYVHFPQHLRCLSNRPCKSVLISKVS